MRAHQTPPRLPNTGSTVELSSKFGCAPGEAVDLIALNISAAVIAEARARGRQMNAEIDRLFPTHLEILAEPGRFLVATAATFFNGFPPAKVVRVNE